MRRSAPSLAILLACATNTLLWAGGPDLSYSSGYAPTYSSGYASTSSGYTPTYSSGYAPSSSAYAPTYSSGYAPTSSANAPTFSSGSAATYSSGSAATYSSGSAATYSSGYAPTYSSGYAASADYGGSSGYAPSYSAAYPPSSSALTPGSIAGPAYTAGFSPTASTYVDPSSVAPLADNGSYQVQRPAYFDNPSVYSGLPTTVSPTAAYQSFRTPLTDSLRGVAAPTATSQYFSAYDGTIPGQAPTMVAPACPPATSIPATTVAPVLPVAPPPKKECCLTRFFRGLCGTNYTTTYFRAPVTYYRPVISTSSVTGAPVVVQQPCTGFEQQVQRIPSSTLTFGQPPVASPPSTCPQSCPTPPSGYGLSAPTSSPTIAPPAGAPSPYGAVGQVGASGSTGGVTAIPSIAPPSTPPTYAPNAAPLSGAPTLAPPEGSNDLAPVERPSLNNPPPVLPPASPPQGDPETTSPTQWQLQNPEDSTALIRPRGTPSTDFGDSGVGNPSEEGQRTPTLPPSLIDNENFTRAEPIEAHDDYEAPYQRQTFRTPRTTPVTQQRTETSLPNPRPYDASELTSVSSRTPASRTSASPSGGRWIRQPSSTVRDTTWTSVRP